MLGKQPIKEMTKAECLRELEQNLDLEALRILAEKSRIPGIGNRLKNLAKLIK
jgi:hypothetical protein